MTCCGIYSFMDKCNRVSGPLDRMCQVPATLSYVASRICDMTPHLAGKGEECQGGNDWKAEDLYVLSVLGFWILCSHCIVNDASQASHSFFSLFSCLFFLYLYMCWYCCTSRRQI
jgi:hypothetical protein